MDRNKPTENDFKEFNAHLLDQGITEKTYLDYKQHFTNWKKKKTKPAAFAPVEQAATIKNPVFR